MKNTQEKLNEHKIKELNDSELDNAVGGTMSLGGIDDETTKYKLGQKFSKNNTYVYEITDIFKKYGRLHYHLTPIGSGSENDVTEAELEKYYEIYY